MKSKKILLGSAMLVGALFMQQAFAATAPVVSFTTGSIINSKHDLSLNSSTTGPKSATISEVCVFCHTPHGADVSKGPLWNRNSAVTTTPAGVYANASSMDSDTLATILQSSVACLTCHDGATSLDAIINKPGNAAASYNTANTGTALFVITGAGTGTVIGGNMGAGTGSDLSDDHPISVAYGGGGFGSASGIRDTDFVTAGNGSLGAAVQLVKNGAAFVAGTMTTAPLAADKFWVETGGSPATRSKQDLPLFVRAGFTVVSGSSTNQPAVECGTCHDVHNAGNSSFLRISNAQSALCFACHIK